MTDRVRWPVYVWRYMAEELPLRFRIREEISLPVSLKDAAPTGLPEELAIHLLARIQTVPPRHRRVAETVYGDFAWQGEEPEGCELRLAAYLVADTFMGSPTRVAGRVCAAWIASSAFAPDDRGAWCPAGPWTLAPVSDAFTGFGPDVYDSPEPRDHGLVILVETEPGSVAAAPPAGRRPALRRG